MGMNHSRDRPWAGSGTARLWLGDWLGWGILLYGPVVLVLACGAAPVTAADATGRPLIVFIFSDDRAPHVIGAYDGWLKAVNLTPNIDALAASGMLFRNSLCTNSICGPSRAVI